ncbi:DUF4230 domain-containing protein [Leadbetterella sp. DM7]|uniref:DUF4230 domain-containing protein n=1 Tax=Leadbetterella sp. DM7 TaxID=3235085 RepID=UPI00349EC228
MRKWITILFYAVIAALLILIWEKVRSFKLFKDREAVTTHNIVLKEISGLGNLELVKYAYRDVVEQSIARDFLPDPKAILIIQGEAVGCIDLRKVTADDIVGRGDTLVVNLPKPEICYHKIDHSRSKVYHTEYAFMNEGLLLEEAYKRAEQQILQSALDSDILEQTRQNADLVLKPLLENTTGKKVVLKYPMEGELRRLK